MKLSLKVLAGLAAASAAWFIVRRTTTGPSNGGGMIEATVIGGDTWPPVPVNPDRRG